MGSEIFIFPKYSPRSSGAGTPLISLIHGYPRPRSKSHKPKNSENNKLCERGDTVVLRNEADSKQPLSVL